MRIDLPGLFHLDNGLSAKTLRIGLILGFFIYGAYGFLDLYTMPSGHTSSWIIRYLIITPIIMVSFGLSYY